MRLLFLITFFLGLTTSLAFSSEYKIIVSSSTTKSAADRIMKQISTSLTKNSTYKSLQKKHRFQLINRPSGNYHIVIIEPLADYKVAKRILKIVHSLRKDAFINTIKINTTVTTTTAPISKSDKVSKIEKTPTPSYQEPLKPAVPTVLPSTVIDAEETKPTVNNIDNNTMPTENNGTTTIIFILIIFLILLSIIIFFFKRSKRLKENVNSDTHLLENAHSDPAILLVLHTHTDIIYGPDNTLKDSKESYDTALKLHKLGFKKLMLTLPILKDETHIDPLFNERVKSLQNKLNKNEVPLTLSIAGEYELDNTIPSLLQDKEHILSFNKNYILCKIPYDKPLEYIKETLLNVIKSGYIPVLVHIEHYINIRTVDEYQSLKDLGIMFQLNISSLPHNNNSEHNQKVQLLIEYGFIDFLAQENIYLNLLEKIINSEQYKAVFKNNTILNNYFLS